MQRENMYMKEKGDVIPSTQCKSRWVKVDTTFII